MKYIQKCGCSALKRGERVGKIEKQNRGVFLEIFKLNLMAETSFQIVKGLFYENPGISKNTLFK